MKVGVVGFCENENCKVLTFQIGVDEAAVGNGTANCPSCGQFGITKGRTPAAPTVRGRPLRDNPQA